MRTGRALLALGLLCLGAVACDRGVEVASGLTRPEVDPPDREETGLAARFKTEALVPSPTAQRARLMAGLGESLSETLERVDGIRRARVHVMLPTRDDLSLVARDAGRPKASVLLICTPPTATTPTDGPARVPMAEDEVKRLVSGAVEDLLPEAVTVVYSFARSTDERFDRADATTSGTAARRSRQSVLLVLLAIAGTLATAVAVLSLRRRGPLIP